MSGITQQEVDRSYPFSQAVEESSQFDGIGRLDACELCRNILPSPSFLSSFDPSPQVRRLPLRSLIGMSTALSSTWRSASSSSRQKLSVSSSRLSRLPCTSRLGLASRYLSTSVFNSHKLHLLPTPRRPSYVHLTVFCSFTASIELLLLPILKRRHPISCFHIVLPGA